MSKEERILAPNTWKNFIIARVGVGKKTLDSYNSIFVPQGYRLYFTCESGLEFVQSDTASLGQKILPETIINIIKTRIEEKKKKKEKINEKYDVITLYWVVNKSRTMKVPFGICAGEKGYHGSVEVTLDEESIGNFITNYICPYEEEEDEETGLIFEYLSEYFINEKNQQRGLSILLRDILLQNLDVADIETKNENGINFSEEKINQAKADFSALGLTMQRVTIEEKPSVSAGEKTESGSEEADKTEDEDE